jgi:hypothetical protein
MHVFGIAALFGLGAFALAMVVDRYLSIATEFWAFVLIGFGIGAAWLADFDVWQLWGIPARADWIGVTLTGLMIGGIALAYCGVARLLSTISRKVATVSRTALATLRRCPNLTPAALARSAPLRIG